MSGSLGRQQKRIVFSACLVSFVAMDSSLTNTIFSYIVDSYPDVPADTLQLFLRIGPIVGTVTALLIGPASMRIPKKAMITFALTTMSAVAAVYILLGGRCPYEVLILCSALDGLETSILSSIPSALVTVSIPNRGLKNRYNGYIQASKFAGALMFSTLGGILAVRGWQRAYGLYLIALPILVLITIFLPRDIPYEKFEHRGSGAEELKGAKESGPAGREAMLPVVMIYLHYVMFFVCPFTLKANLSIYIISEYQLGTSVEAGLVNSMNTLAGILAGLCFGILSRRIRRWMAPILSILILAGFLLFAFWTTSLAGCMIGTFLIGFAKGCMTPFVIFRLSLHLPKKHVATSISLLIAFMNFGQSISTPIIRTISHLFGTYSVHTQLLSTAALAGVLTIAAILLYVIPEDPAPEHHHHKHHQ